MKYIKKFENLNDEPQIGDYVLVNPKNKNLEWLKNIVGKIKLISEIYQRGIMKKQYEIEFDTKERNIFNGRPIWVFNLDEIIHYSKNKEELENINKYNL